MQWGARAPGCTVLRCAVLQMPSAHTCMAPAPPHVATGASPPSAMEVCPYMVVPPRTDGSFLGTAAAGPHKTALRLLALVRVPQALSACHATNPSGASHTLRCKPGCTHLHTQKYTHGASLGAGPHPGSGLLDEHGALSKTVGAYSCAKSWASQDKLFAGWMSMGCPL